MAKKRPVRPDSNQGLLDLPNLQLSVPRMPDNGVTNETLTVKLDTLHEGSILCREESAALYAITRVSLDYHKSSSPVCFIIDEQGKKQHAIAKWAKPSHKHRMTYKYSKKRIENSAECIALATLRARCDLLIIQRAEDLTGSDWIVGYSLGDLENGMRVEVSGIDDAQDVSEVRTRLARKVQQLHDGQSRVPSNMSGIAAIVALKQGTVTLESVDLSIPNPKGNN